LLHQPKPHTRPFQASLNGALRLRCSINFDFWVPRKWHHCRQFELLTSKSHGALAGQSNGEVEGPHRSAGPWRRGRTISQRPRRQARNASRTPPTIVRSHDPSPHDRFTSERHGRQNRSPGNAKAAPNHIRRRERIVRRASPLRLNFPGRDTSGFLPSDSSPRPLGRRHRRRYFVWGAQLHREGLRRLVDESARRGEWRNEGPSHNAEENGSGDGK